MSGLPVLLTHPSSLEHDTGGHPEQAGRIIAIERALAERDGLGWERVESPPASLEALLAVHPESHVEMIRRMAESGGGWIDADTVVSAGSFDAARHAAGGAVELVDRLLDGRAPTGFSVHRPPGHHAETARAMGFCLFNSVAVAARHARSARGLGRVMIVDWDVHHGNGTNDIFHEDPSVLFCSIHQSPLYPGTGPAADTGSGDGRGYTVNLPVGPGSGDETFGSLLEHVVVPLGEAFSPELLLVSAGFDAHAEDPLASCRVSEPGFAAMAGSLLELGRRVDAPVGCVLEGGYAHGALARSVLATMEVLAGGAPISGEARPAPAVAPESHAALQRLREFWPGLGSA